MNLKNRPAIHAPILISTLLAGSMVMASGSVAAAAEQDPAVALSGGSFSWGFNTSFLGHLASPVAGGQITATDGAEFMEQEFTFPVDINDSTIDGEGKGEIELEGGIDLKAYAGMGADGGWGLDLSYDDLSLKVQGTSVALIGDYSLFGGKSSGDDVELITFTLSERIDPGPGTFRAEDVVTAAAQGVKDSLGRYDVGTPMASADLELTFTKADSDQEPVTNTGSSAGSNIFKDLAQALGGIFTTLAQALRGIFNL